MKVKEGSRACLPFSLSFIRKIQNVWKGQALSGLTSTTSRI